MAERSLRLVVSRKVSCAGHRHQDDGLNLRQHKLSNPIGLVNCTLPLSSELLRLPHQLQVQLVDDFLQIIAKQVVSCNQATPLV